MSAADATLLLGERFEGVVSPERPTWEPAAHPADLGWPAAPPTTGSSPPRCGAAESW